VSERLEKIREAYLRLDGGSVAEFETLFAAGAQWLGIPGTGFEGETPT
jgi:hypothetical protein